jgi:hypothetical protein
MSPLSLLVCLAGAIDLGSWDFQPWESVVPVADPVASPLVASHLLQVVYERRDVVGTLRYKNTMRFWTDARGVCRSDRWWDFTDTATLEAIDLQGVHAGRSALPPDSGRTSRTVGGNLREVGTLRSQHSARRSLWVFERDPVPEGFHFDWDSTIVDRDAKGRIIHKREVWTDFAWTSDSILWGADDTPSRWITRSGGGWGDMVETHSPTWSAGRLIGDEVLTVTSGMSGTPDSTNWSVSCSWIEDSLLRGCTTTRIRSTDTTVHEDRRGFDSLAVIRDEARRPRRLESFLGGRFQELTLWDIQGRKVSRRTLVGDEPFQRLSMDSSQFGDLPWPIRSEYRSGYVSTLFDTASLSDVTTYQWELDPKDVGVSRRVPSNPVRVFLDGSRLHVAAHGSVSGTVQILDPAGRTRERTPLRDGRASVVLPKNGGVWIWRLTDADDREIQRGRIAIP